MSEQLVNEYIEGRISRRTLIRRLLAAGVSFGAAVSYAHMLQPDRAAAGGLADQHFMTVTGRILDQDLDRVIADERVQVRFAVPRQAKVTFRIYLRRPWLAGQGSMAYSLIGERTLRTRGAVRRNAWVPLAVNPPHSVDALRPLTKARLDLSTTVHRHRDPRWGSDFDQRTLSR